MLAFLSVTGHRTLRFKGVGWGGIGGQKLGHLSFNFFFFFKESFLFEKEVLLIVGLT